MEEVRRLPQEEKQILKRALSNNGRVVHVYVCVYVLLGFFSQETYSMAKSMESDGHCFKF